jgi:hypothetical protein
MLIHRAAVDSRLRMSAAGGRAVHPTALNHNPSTLRPCRRSLNRTHGWRDREKLRLSDPSIIQWAHLGGAIRALPRPFSMSCQNTKAQPGHRQSGRNRSVAMAHPRCCQSRRNLADCRPRRDGIAHITFTRLQLDKKLAVSGDGGASKRQTQMGPAQTGKMNRNQEGFGAPS